MKPTKWWRYCRRNKVRIRLDDRGSLLVEDIKWTEGPQEKHEHCAKVEQ